MGAAEFPSRRATLEVSASWPGLNWNRSAISGVARSQLAKVAFQAGIASRLYPGLARFVAGRRHRHARRSHGSPRGPSPERLIAGRHRQPGAAQRRVGGIARPPPRITHRSCGGRQRALDCVLGGTLQVPTAALQVRAGKLSIGKWTGADLEVHADYSATRIAVSQARLAWAGQEVELTGEIGGTSAEAPLQLEGKLEGRSRRGNLYASRHRRACRRDRVGRLSRSVEPSPARRRKLRSTPPGSALLGNSSRN